MVSPSVDPVRVFSGIKPTGEVHLGNFLGAIRRWVDDQHRGQSIYCVVDLHALTVPGDPAELRRATTTLATVLLAAGLDPAVCTLFVQSHVPAHSQLAWLMECTASMGEMRRMTQFKDKAAKGDESSLRVGFFTYPALMAADIVLYDTDEVPVGDDQRQHVELARDLAQRFNTLYGDTFVIPRAVVAPAGLGDRIMDLQEPTRKMSKTSESPQGSIALLDDLKSVERKIKRAVTDTEAEVRYDPETKPGVSNLLELLAAATGEKPDDLAGRYSQYGPLKADVASAVIALIEPIQARYRELAADPGYVTSVLAEGAAKAAVTAGATLERAYRAIGLLPAS